MILQRISKGIKNQDWFTVVVEIFIVVIGIYIGLQVDDWNKARLERVEERVYLERLVEDMETSLQKQENQIERITINKPHYDNVVDAFIQKNFNEEAKQSLKFILPKLFAVARPLTDFKTINELQSSGKLSLIRSIQIRSLISDLQQAYALEIDVMKNLQQIGQNLAPNALKYIIVNERHIKNKTNFIDDEISTILKDRNFMSAMVTLGRYQGVSIGRIIIYTAQTQNLLTALKKELTGDKP